MGRRSGRRPRWFSRSGLNAEFFVELAGQGLLRRLAGFDFASRELPLQGHGLVGAALADEHLAVADDERRRDKPERGPRRPGAGKLLGTFHMPSVQGPQDSQNEGVWDRSYGDGWSVATDRAGFVDSHLRDRKGSEDGAREICCGRLFAVDGGGYAFGGGGAEVAPSVARRSFEQG